MTKEADEKVPLGDFRIVKMDDMFHVVFRPDDAPEWFRIIASFYTYDRAYYYCDTERVLTYELATCTSDEQKDGLRAPPLVSNIDKAVQEAGIEQMVRDVYPTSEAVPPLPKEDFSDHPETSLILPEARFEEPKDYYRRLTEQEAAMAIARQADDFSDLPDELVEQLSSDVRKTSAEARSLSEPEPLPERQQAVYDFFLRSANPLNLVEASTKEISIGAGVPHGSMGFLLETLEKKRLVFQVERGGPSRKSVFRVTPAKVAA